MWRCLGWLVFQRGQLPELPHQKVNSMRFCSYLQCARLSPCLLIWQAPLQISCSPFATSRLGIKGLSSL